ETGTRLISRSRVGQRGLGLLWRCPQMPAHGAFPERDCFVGIVLTHSNCPAPRTDPFPQGCSPALGVAPTRLLLNLVLLHVGFSRLSWGVRLEISKQLSRRVNDQRRIFYSDSQVCTGTNERTVERLISNIGERVG